MGKKKKKPKAHLCETGNFTGVLSRNSTYREDSWGHLKGTGLYDWKQSILNAIVNRDAATGKPGGRNPKSGKLVNNMTQQQRSQTYVISYYSRAQQFHNFKVGRIPYANQAHHIVPCEVFYDKKWTAAHLNVLFDAGYNINNEKNIIYLPQCCGRTYLRDYHVLPDHSKGHGKYNDRLLKKCDSIFDLVDQAVQEEDCEKAADIKDQIKTELETLESNNYTTITGLGGGELS